MSFIIATFYHFVELSNYYDMKDEIKTACANVELKSTILLAEEGVNATISGKRNGIDEIFDFLHSDYRLKGLTWKESAAKYQLFNKMKVKLKREIVNLVEQCFREFPQWAESFSEGKHLKVAMYCTGLIRCEKSTKYEVLDLTMCTT